MINTPWNGNTPQNISTKSKNKQLHYVEALEDYLPSSNDTTFSKTGQDTYISLETQSNAFSWHFRWLKNWISKTPPPWEKLAVISWICLFGNNTLTWLNETWDQVILTDPRKLPSKWQLIDILGNPNLSPYDIDYLCRIPKGVLEWMNPEMINSVSFHIPRVEYYLYYLDSPLLWPDLLNKYIEKIDLQSNYVSKAIKKRVPKSLQEKTQTIEPLAEIWAYIKQELAQSKKPSVQELSEKITDPFLKQYFQMNPPSSLKDIVNASYIAAYIQNMEQWFWLALENTNEMKILIQTDEAIKSLWCEVPWMIAWYIPSHSTFQEDEFNYFADIKSSVNLTKSIIWSYLKTTLTSNPTHEA